MHVAELNIGRVKYALDDPRMAGFMDNLDRINALAERSPGSVCPWNSCMTQDRAFSALSMGLRPQKKCCAS